MSPKKRMIRVASIMLRQQLERDEGMYASRSEINSRSGRYSWYSDLRYVLDEEGELLSYLKTKMVR